VALPSRRTVQPCRAIDLDFSDPDTQLAMAGCVLGLVFGIGAPVWYTNRTEVDNQRLEELRALNRATYEETGEYMSESEIEKFRKPKWTDRRCAGRRPPRGALGLAAGRRGCVWPQVLAGAPAAPAGGFSLPMGSPPRREFVDND
jgi:hypothetical protein